MKIILGFQKHFPDDIEFYWKWAAEITKWGTKSDYFHVEIAIDNKWVGAHTESGIEIHEYDPNHFNSFFDYFEIEVEDLPETQKALFWKWVEGEAGSGYDWIGIYLTQFLFMDWESKDKWFCSEIAAKMLQMLYVEGFLDVKPNRLSPQNVYDILANKMVPLKPTTDHH